jgi:glycosyltransferase involved in cell wall biosynthesis
VRVLLVGTYPVDLARVQGGAEASFLTLASGLARQPGLELHVITFVPGLAQEMRREASGVRVDYVPTLRKLRSVTRHLPERRALARKVDALQPDLIHAQDALHNGFICLRAVSEVPVLVSIHGIARAEFAFVRSRVDRLRMVLFKVPVERYCIGHARYLVQPTRYPEQFFGHEITGRIWDVGNPISDALFAVEPAPEPGRILFIGAFIERKRLLDLVEALPRVVARVPSAHLRVVGFAANPEYVHRVHARVLELGLQGRVTFLQGLTSDDVLDEYRRGSVLALPSGEETSPMVIGEAMAARMPVVATRVGGVHYLVDDGRTGHIVDAGDVEGLGARIGDVLVDPAAGAALGQAGRAKAERSFRTDAVAERVRRVYEEVVRSDPVRSRG